MTAHPADMVRREAEAPAFFSEKVDACIAGKSDADALTDLAELITDAAAAKDAGHGPPIHELNRARRKWLDIYERLHARTT